jgi:hypothetical protein
MRNLGLVPAGHLPIKRCLNERGYGSGRLEVNTEVGLGGELFIHRFDHFVEIEGFFKHAACAE